MYLIWISSSLSTIEKFVLIKHNNRKLRNYVVGLFLPSKKQQAVSTVYRDVLKCTSKRRTEIPSADREGESVQEGQGWERKVDVRGAWKSGKILVGTKDLYYLLTSEMSSMSHLQNGNYSSIFT